MCLGVPGKILAIHDLVATVDFFGVRRDVALHIVDEPVSVGDHVLVHVGFAIRRIPPEDVAQTLDFYRELATEELGPPPEERP
ncbi:MAG: hydrogenase assembly chaperone hypC/hupF [Labilithrix sp.]|nr:hydrogenase assembly chaperone hypC/hupF [Labilithrix sp.]